MGVKVRVREVGTVRGGSWGEEDAGGKMKGWVGLVHLFLAHE